MKKIRIICLVLALVLAIPMVASCAGKKVVSKNVTIIFQEPKDLTAAPGTVKEYNTLFEYTFSEVEGIGGESPTVLQVAEEALRKYEKDYEISKDGTYISSVFGHTEQNTADATTGYYSFWEVFINGEKSSDGRQSVTLVYDDDKIVFTWTYDTTPRRDTDAIVTTDPNEDTTAEDPNAEVTTADPDDDLA